ncbi:MAG TPA: NADH-quinone oxidoreductase subunit C [Chitinophagaceae bacterium]|nr:NADH-quinone oxidoreductase subunit C [Chitinophagaceae bacterium]
MTAYFNDIKENIEKEFQSFQNWNTNSDIITFEVSASEITKLLEMLYHDFQFQFLTDLTAVHYPEKEKQELCVVYHLHNLSKRMRLRIKVYLDITKPNIPTAINLFSAANWMERETFDFFGVHFVGHPNLTRILNVEDMDYFPMRKEYPMEDPTRIDKDDHMFGR